MRNNATFPALPPIDDLHLRQLAAFRYQLRRFLRFSEQAARAHGLTPQQHQLLLGIAGFTGRGWATITELAEFLQERHNAVVGLVQRAERAGLVRKDYASNDQRFVRVRLLPKGQRILAKLSQLHQKEVYRFEQGFLRWPAGPETGNRPERGGIEFAERPPARRQSQSPGAGQIRKPAPLPAPAGSKSGGPNRPLDPQNGTNS